MIVFSILLMLAGFAVIIKGGDWFVGAAAWFAEATGLPRLLVGATIVSLATTLPEYFVSVLAVARQSYDFGVSNAIGSVLSNTGLIMSLSLIAAPRKIGSGLFYRKAAVMLLALGCFFIFLLDRRLSIQESLPLFGLLIYFIFINIRHASESNGRIPEEKQQQNRIKFRKGIWKNVLRFAGGAAFIILGARLLVDNGIRIAQALHVPEGVISVTLVAFGTSLPELVTTITAIAKKETSMGIGNILGANILNLTLLTGSCALVSGGSLHITAEYERMIHVIMPRTLYLDIPFTALLFLILIVPTVLSGGRVFRAQGVLMLLLYLVFVLFVIVNQ